MREAASVVKVAEQLPPFERAKFTEHLLDTPDKLDPEIDTIWSIECEQRLDAYLLGEAKPLAASDVLSRHLNGT